MTVKQSAVADSDKPVLWDVLSVRTVPDEGNRKVMGVICGPYEDKVEAEYHALRLQRQHGDVQYQREYIVQYIAIEHHWCKACGGDDVPHTCTTFFRHLNL